MEKLGYKPFGMVERGFGLSTDELLAEYESFNDSGLENILKVSGTEGYKETIDCGDNEELFLTLAALRDDTDKNQYWICDKVSVTLGKTYYPNDYIYYQYNEFFDKQNWHKATVEEIIEHFKIK